MVLCRLVYGKDYSGDIVGLKKNGLKLPAAP